MDYIVRHLRKQGLTGLAAEGEWYQPFPYERNPSITAHNVLAVFPGKGALANEAIIVSAHHDHLGIDPERVKAGRDGIFNGADDNASGFAAVLLAAQALHAARDRLPASYRTVIFAVFDGEEIGLFGSRYYLEHPLWPLDKTTADINFDMVGRLFRGRLLAGDSESSSYMAQRITVPGGPVRNQRRDSPSCANRADSSSFLDRAIPAVHFNTGLHADYHQVTDEVDRLDCEGGARVSWLAYRLLREMMENPERLRFRQPPPNFDIQGVLRLIFRLGVVPEQNAQAGHNPLISVVIPNSVAAKQGFKAGDEITAINGQQFESLFDAIVVIGKLRFDRDIEIAILRKGQKFSLKIPPRRSRISPARPCAPLGKIITRCCSASSPAKKSIR